MECFVTFIQECGHFRREGYWRAVRQFVACMVGDACLRGIGYYDFQVRAARDLHEVFIVFVWVDAPRHGCDDLDIFNRLPVLGTAHGKRIYAVLCVDHVFESLRDGLAEYDAAMVDAVPVRFVDHPVHECAEEVSLPELEYFFRIVPIFFFDYIIDRFHFSVSPFLNFSICSRVSS